MSTLEETRMLTGILLIAAVGAFDPHVTQENIHTTICVPGYAASVRPSRQWSAAFKTRLLKQAGIPQSERSKYEMDHIIPLEVGGCPTCRENVTLQPWDGPDGAKVKDKVENHVHHLVCSGKMTLEKGQACFVGDWRMCR